MPQEMGMGEDYSHNLEGEIEEEEEGGEEGETKTDLKETVTCPWSLQLEM